MSEQGIEFEPDEPEQDVEAHIQPPRDTDVERLNK
jgi:hypothetical protein